MKTLSIATALALATLLIAGAAYAEPGKDKVVRFSLSVAVAGLGVADTLLTIHGTKNLGLVEVNPLLRGYFERGEYFPVWTAQVLGTFVVIGAANWLISMDDKVAKIAGYAILVSAVLFRGYLVIHNANLNRRAARGF